LCIILYPPPFICVINRYTKDHRIVKLHQWTDPNWYKLCGCVLIFRPLLDCLRLWYEPQSCCYGLAGLRMRLIIFHCHLTNAVSMFWYSHMYYWQTQSCVNMQCE
jgi:hypothetical protein